MRAGLQCNEGRKVLQTRRGPGPRSRPTPAAHGRIPEAAVGGLRAARDETLR